MTHARALSAPLLSSSAALGARQVCLHRLDEADAAAARLVAGKRDDTEALHDFRVALRRLRTLLRAYAPHLSDTVKRRWQKRLGELARATNVARDAEVQQARFSDLDAAVAALWGRRVDVAYAEIRRDVLPAHAEVAAGLRRRLSTHRPEIDLSGQGAEPPSFAVVTADLVAEQGQHLLAALAGVQSIADQERMHAARLDGKRLRYLLEPWRKELPAAKVLLTACKHLQDTLGELNDAYVLLDTLAVETPDLPAASREQLRLVAAADRDRTFAEALRLRDQGELRALVDSIEALADQLRALGSGGGATDRLLLLNGVPRRARSGERLDIRQHIRGDGKARLREELRRVRGAHGEVRWRLIGTAGPREATLREQPNDADFAKLWRLSADEVLRRQRFVVDEEGEPRVCVDSLTGLRLVLAVVEGRDSELPKWLARRVVREVSGDPAFERYRLRDVGTEA